jgi:hypothetical protein
MDACRIISISSAIFVACKFPWHWTLLLEADGRIWTLAGTGHSFGGVLLVLFARKVEPAVELYILFVVLVLFKLDHAFICENSTLCDMS